MSLLRRLILAALLALSAVPAFGQAPPPVPALPDAERRTSYSISASTCSCSIGFQIYGDAADFGSWIEVFLNGVLQSSSTYTITSPTGSLATIPRPITDAILTFNVATTGTVQIVGARRPRRSILFAENRGVAARDLNQAVNDIVAMLREDWDKINDVTGRAILAAPGEKLALLPAKAARANQGACFDTNGNLINCVSIPSSTFSAGAGITFTGTNPTVISTPTYSAGSGIAFTGSNPTVISSTLRTLLTGPTTFYFSLTGNDNTGNGTSGNPWRHLQYAYSYVQAHYDTGGQTVTLHTNDTSVTFPDCFVATGPLVGQLSAGSVIIDYNNNTQEGTNSSNCTGGNIYAMGANGNASYLFENVTLSVCGTANTAGSGNDMVNIGQGSTLFVGPNVVFGCAFSQWNQISINGILVIQNGYTIQAKNVTTTGTWATSGNTVSVTNATGWSRPVVRSTDRPPNASHRTVIS
jgi:hypothetical protein